MLRQHFHLQFICCQGIFQHWHMIMKRRHILMEQVIVCLLYTSDAGLYGYSMAIGVVIFIFSFALSALVNKVTEREPCLLYTSRCV